MFLTFRFRNATNLLIAKPSEDVWNFCKMIIGCVYWALIHNKRENFKWINLFGNNNSISISALIMWLILKLWCSYFMLHFNLWFKYSEKMGKLQQCHNAFMLFCTHTLPLPTFQRWLVPCSLLLISENSVCMAAGEGEKLFYFNSSCPGMPFEQLIPIQLQC